MSRPTGLEAAALLSVAFHLLEAGRQSGDAAFFRRAVSTAYYAVFHCLARVCADRLLRDAGAGARGVAWRRVYRSPQHGQVRKRCGDARGLARYPDGIRRFAHGFPSIQDRRHAADYDPDCALDAGEVRRQLVFALELVRALEEAPRDDQRDFATHVLLPVRRT